MKKLTIRWSMYGCDTGWDGFELVDEEENRIGWTFGDFSSEEEALYFFSEKIEKIKKSDSVEVKFEDMRVQNGTT